MDSRSLRASTSRHRRARPRRVADSHRGLSGITIGAATYLGGPLGGASPTLGTVSCHVERPLDDAIWARFVEFQRSRPGGFRIAALMRPPSLDAGELEDVWLERAAIAREQGPFGHHTHFGGVERARPPAPARAAEHLRHEAQWLRERRFAPRFWCGGGWYLTPDVANVLADFAYVDCTATAFGIKYLAGGAPHVQVAEPSWLRLEDGRKVLELPATHSPGMAARLVRSPRPIAGPVVHVYFHDWELTDRHRAVLLRAVLVVLGRRCRQSDLELLADEVGHHAREVPLVNAEQLVD